MKKSELKQIIKEVYQELNEFECIDDEYDTSNVNRTNLKKFLSMLDSKEIDYSYDGSKDILSFDSTELSKIEQKYMTKIGI